MEKSKKQTASLQKLSWKDVRKDVHSVNPELATIIDELDPGPEYWLAKVTYPYGSLVMKRALLMLPNPAGDLVPVTDSSLASDIREGLSYNLLSNPVSLVLKNTFEIFLPLPDRAIPLSGLIEPGTAFGAWRVLNPQKAEQPAFIWDMTAGARSVFLLPKITETKKHRTLVRKYALTVDVPRSLIDHFEIFKQLASHRDFRQPWQGEILYFSHAWFKQLKDLKWKPFYYYFHDSAWGSSELWRNQFIWDLIFSLILKDYETRPNAHIMDTAKYLIYMGGSAFPGLIAARNSLAGPFAEIQRIYQEEYDIRNYPPIIMQPGVFDMHDPNGQSVYYSLQFPNAGEFKPSSRIRTSIVSDLHEIRSLIVRCNNELSSDKFNLGGTSLGKVFDYTHYDYFHNGTDLHAGMRRSAEMPKEDKSLITTLDGEEHYTFPDSSAFVKGCIRLSHKKKGTLA